MFIKVADSLLVMVSVTVLLTSGRRGAVGDGIPGVLQSTTSSSSLVLLQVLDQWRSITSQRFVLNMVKGHHPQLRSCPLFCNFK